MWPRSKGGKDFKNLSGTLSFVAGQTAQSILVPLLGDPASNAGEDFFVKLSSPSNAAIGVPKGTYTFESQILVELLDALAASQKATSRTSPQKLGTAVDEAIRLILTDVS